jgi:hypothetical protein
VRKGPLSLNRTSQGQVCVLRRGFNTPVFAHLEREWSILIERHELRGADGSFSWDGRGADSNRIMKISASIVTTFLQADPRHNNNCPIVGYRFLGVIGNTKSALNQPPLDKPTRIRAKSAATPFLTNHLSCSAEAFV